LRTIESNNYLGWGFDKYFGFSSFDFVSTSSTAGTAFVITDAFRLKLIYYIIY